MSLPPRPAPSSDTVHLRVGGALTEHPRCGTAKAKVRHVLATNDSTLVTCRRCLQLMAMDVEQALHRRVSGVETVHASDSQGVAVCGVLWVADAGRLKPPLLTKDPFRVSCMDCALKK